MRRLLIVILILVTATVSFGDVALKTVYQWNYIDLLWKDEKQKEDAINSGKYNASSCVLYDVDKAPDGRIFVTMVRQEGVPASLMTVSKKEGSEGPRLNPYPDWSWYENENDCNGSIISVYRVFIKCNRIFVLDCGKIGEDAVCPPKLLIFNLKNDSLIERILIPSHIANNENNIGLLVTPLVYVQDCKHINDATIFMADVEGFGLVIYKNSSFCRLESNYMKPTNPNFTIENQSFNLADGPLGLTMIDTKLYYALLAGNDIYKIDINNLRKCSELSKSEIDKLTQLAGTLSGQTAAIASEQCAIFFSNIPETSILCQDASKKFESDNTEIIVQDSERLQFAAGMKVVNYGMTMLILTNRFQRVINNELNLNETNFRILSVYIPEIRKKTNCFTSCNENYREPGHTPWPYEPWHGRPWHDNPWHGRPWHGRPWRGRPWHRRL